jgi:hypothetical protein
MALHKAWLPLFVLCVTLAALLLLTLGPATAFAQVPRLPVGATLICGDTMLIRSKGRDGAELVPLKGKVRIAVTESWRDSTDAPAFLLSSVTVEQFSGGIPLYGLVYGLPGKFLYFPFGTLSPDFGPSMFGPAREDCRIPLTVGTTALEVALHGQTDQYQIALTDTTILLRSVRQGRISMLGDSARFRLPRASFFFECAVDEAQARWCQSSRRSVATVPGVTPDSFRSSEYRWPYGGSASRRIFYVQASDTTMGLILRRMQSLGWTRSRDCDELYAQIGDSHGTLYQFFGCRATILQHVQPN